MLSITAEKKKYQYQDGREASGDRRTIWKGARLTILWRFLWTTDDYFMEAQIAMLVQEAEKLYNKLVKDLANRIVYDAAFNSNSTSSLSLLSSSSDETKVVISFKASSLIIIQGLIKSSNIGALAKSLSCMLERHIMTLKSNV